MVQGARCGAAHGSMGRWSGVSLSDFHWRHVLQWHANNYREARIGM